MILFMIIKKAGAKDIDKLVDLMIDFKEALNPSVLDFMKKYRVEHRPRSEIRNSVFNEITNPRGLFLVAKEKRTSREFMGFCYITKEEWKHMVFTPVLKGTLQHIYIDSEHRGKGLASKFHEKAMEWFKDNGCEFVSLRVLDVNPAHDIYKKWGFKDSMEEMVLDLQNN